MRSSDEIGVKGKMAEWTKYVDESALSVPVLQAFSLSASLLSLRHTRLAQFCMSLPFKGAFSDKCHCVV